MDLAAQTIIHNDGVLRRLSLSNPRGLIHLAKISRLVRSDTLADPRSKPHRKAANSTRQNGHDSCLFSSSRNEPRLRKGSRRRGLSSNPGSVIKLLRVMLSALQTTHSTMVGLKIFGVHIERFLERWARVIAWPLSVVQVMRPPVTRCHHSLLQPTFRFRKTTPLA